MHKSHGEVVTQVLQQQIVEHAAKLVEGAIDDTSMLGLVIGKKHLEYQSQLAAEPGEHGPARGAMISPSSVQPQNAALAQVEEVLLILALWPSPTARLAVILTAGLPGVF